MIGRQTRSPPENSLRRVTSIRKESVKHGMPNCTFVRRSFSTGHGQLSFFHEPSAVLHETPHDVGTRHWPLPSSSNQYTSKPMTEQGFSHENSTHSSVPRCGQNVQRETVWSPELNGSFSLRTFVGDSFPLVCEKATLGRGGRGGATMGRPLDGGVNANGSSRGETAKETRPLPTARTAPAVSRTSRRPERCSNVNSFPASGTLETRKSSSAKGSKTMDLPSLASCTPQR